MRRFTLNLVLTAGLVLVSTASFGQSAIAMGRVSDDSPMHLGYPQDWSFSHLVMAGGGAERALAEAAYDPRHAYNYVMRQVAMENLHEEQILPFTALKPKRHTRIDWAVSLENGYVKPNQFPAKYRFDLNSKDCNGDYAVFALTVTTGTQANLVGINNLYTEAAPACNNGSPWVAFAYNTVTQTGGQNKTSPVLSNDGTKIAFVESTTTGSYFHVIVLPNPIPAPPSQSGTVLSPQTPTSCAKPTTAGCMTTLTIQIGADSTNSSPWVDYASDTAYVGADNGLMYKITPVFGGGAPALVIDANWPVTVSTQASKVLTAPILDTKAGRLFIGDGTGYLYSVDVASPAHTYAARQTIGWAGHGAGTGIVDPPIVVVDSANSGTDQVFTFTGCSNVIGIGGAANQIAANFTNTSTYTTVDLGSGSGNGDCTGGNVHQGIFDNAFWVNGSASGHLLACGFVSGTAARPLIPSNPKMYMFPFVNHLVSSAGSSTFVINPTVGEECSPLTEFYDGTTDRLLFGVGGPGDGHVEASTITSSLTTPSCTAGSSSCVTTPNALGGTSGIIVDNQLANGGINLYFSTLANGSVNGQKCKVTGGAANPYCAVKLTQAGLN